MRPTTTFWMMTVTAIELIWDELETSGELGGARRVDDEHPSDFYCSIDARGRRGMILLTDVEPPFPPPGLDAVEIFLGRRGDGRCSFGLWLANQSLSAVFSLLCQDLVSASRSLPPDDVPLFVVSRLLRWQDLFAPAGSELMSLEKLRGLVGELVVLRQCMDLWDPVTAIAAWQGPFGGQQDFAAPELFIEVKTVGTSARTVQINSAEQLCPTDQRQLILAVVILSSAAAKPESGIAVSDLTRAISELTSHDRDALLKFERSLLAAGYSSHVDYEKIHFYIDSINYYRVGIGFPRMCPDQLAPGIRQLWYNVALSACKPFETSLGSLTSGS
jgi:hypothetical protein